MEAVQAHIKPSLSKKTLKSGIWLPAEDQRLREAVSKHGTRWIVVSGEVGTRNGDQCAKRWNENLNPELDHSPWTPEEDNQLLSLVEINGRNWKFISSHFFEARAPLALKSRYSLLMRRLKRLESSQNGNLKLHSLPVPSLGTTRPAVSRTNSDGQSDIFSHELLNSNYHSDTFITPDTESFPFSSSFPLDGIMPTCEKCHNIAQEKEDQLAHPTTLRDTTITWSDPDMAWPQRFISESGLELMGLSDRDLSCDENEMDNMNLDYSHSTTPTWCPKQSTGRLPSAPESESGSVNVEYKITCRRGKIKSVVKHLVDLVMAESVDGNMENDQVTLILQMKN